MRRVVTLALAAALAAAAAGCEEKKGEAPPTPSKSPAKMFDKKGPPKGAAKTAGGA